MATHELSNFAEQTILDDQNEYVEGVSTDWEVQTTNDSIIEGISLLSENCPHELGTITLSPNILEMSDATRDAIETLFGRTYVSPISIDPGFITEEITQNIVVWNADSENLSVLSSITVDESDGLSLQYPSLPTTIAHGGDEILILTIELEGPPIQNSNYTVVAGGFTYVVNVAGIRAIGLEVNPNWNKTLATTYSFVTAIGSNSRYFREQRRPLSRLPWRDVQGVYEVEGLKSIEFSNNLHYGHDKVFVVPLYNEQLTCSVITITSDVITPVEDFSLYYNLNNNCTHLIFIDTVNDLVEIKEIDTVGASTITFVTGIQNNFSPGSTVIYPGVFSILQSVQINNEHKGYQVYTLQFQEFKKNG